MALKWIREYQNFIRYHYRPDDDVIKSSLNGTPLREAIYCENHLQLLQECDKKWPSFYVCKTSSLSGFISPKITEDALSAIGMKVQIAVNEKSDDKEKNKWVYTLGKKSNDLIYKYFSTNDEPPFDLLIFDEAHYLRRAEGDSLRSIAAHAFFAGRISTILMPGIHTNRLQVKYFA
ncbi:MAG: hypothetical protein IPP15_16195 [Saprospiraceae bacterium]|uniref:Uncharacterized protein n=1 Tax=Candidatus Opimibacter skivensis TaxID=2982028 RepID=A0A9D7SZZ4_9BACT|nr:hypothetical protein [Candidatus Opimibacter skivensis]